MFRISDEDVRQWRKERDIAVSSLSVEDFKKFYKKWEERGVYEEPLPNDRVAEIALYKMAMDIRSIPQSVKDRAHRWLEERGYKDGFGGYQAR